MNSESFSILYIDLELFIIKYGVKIGKTYLCLFVCFKPQAIRLKVVFSQVFITALYRFVVRRGCVFSSEPNDIDALILGHFLMTYLL